MTDKRKNEQRIGRMTFYLVWILASVIGSFVPPILSAVLTGSFSAMIIASGMLWITIIFLVTFVAYAIVGYIQYTALNHFRSIRMRFWWFVTAIGFAMSTILPSFTWLILSEFLIGRSTMIVVLVNVIIPYSLIGMLQSYLLRHYFKHSWIYALMVILAGYAGAVASNGLMVLSNEGAIIFAVCTSLTLLWLDHVTYHKSKISSSSIHSVEAQI